MPVDLNNLLQSVYDYFLHLYNPSGTDTHGTYLAFERIGQPVPPSEFKLKPDDAQFSPQVAEERFSALVNSMLKVAPEVFSDTPMKVDDFHSMLLMGATPGAVDAPALQFFANLKAQAKKDFEHAQRESMFLGGPSFSSARATPRDWFDGSNPDNWTPCSFSASAPPPAASPSPTAPPAARQRFQVAAQATWKLDPEPQTVHHVLEGNPDMAARVGPMALRDLEGPVLVRRASALYSPALNEQLDPGEQLHLRRLLAERAPTHEASSNDFTLSFKYCLVKIDRSWIYEPFLQTPSWYLPGSSAGDYSTGRLDNNTGERRFPGLPVAFIAIKELQITANWSGEDADRAQKALGLGPFSLAGSTFNSSSLSAAGVQIIAWVCTVLPLLPPTDDPAIAKEKEVPAVTAPIAAGEWQHVGHANDVVALTAVQGKLFHATRDNTLWCRDPVHSDIKWTLIGHANELVAMTGLKDMLYCVTRGNILYVRAPHLFKINWTRIGHANQVVGLAGVANTLYCATTENLLWKRDSVPRDLHWTRIGIANKVVAMTSTDTELLCATTNGQLWRRDPGPSDILWQALGPTPAGTVTGLAVLAGHLWATTTDNRLYARKL